jgi:sugar/nucleoside kinase (ribokinase family)
MPSTYAQDPVDYLVVGHLSCDLTPDGPRLGGTVCYSALTALALGMRVGIVTAGGQELSLAPLDGIQLVIAHGGQSTTFENIQTPQGRVQYIHHIAPDLKPKHIPEPWRRAPIVHIGPIAQEAKSLMDCPLSSCLLGVTPQGWLRSWDSTHRVRACRWPETDGVLKKAGAVVLSIEDVNGDEDLLQAMACNTRVLAVTEGPAGARLYWNGDLRRFQAPARPELDPTGAGDIFAAGFFWRLSTTRDPWAAASFATQLASCSVTRKGLAGVPTPQEIQACLQEVL